MVSFIFSNICEGSVLRIHFRSHRRLKKKQKPRMLPSVILFPLVDCDRQEWPRLEPSQSAGCMAERRSRPSDIVLQRESVSGILEKIPLGVLPLPADQGTIVS